MQSACLGNRCTCGFYDQINAALTAGREALAQPEQTRGEAVAWQYRGDGGAFWQDCSKERATVRAANPAKWEVRALYTHPQASEPAPSTEAVKFCYTFKTDEAADAYQSRCDIDVSKYDKASFDVGYGQGRFDEQQAQGPYPYPGDAPSTAGDAGQLLKQFLQSAEDDGVTHLTAPADAAELEQFLHLVGADAQQEKIFMKDTRAHISVTRNASGVVK